MAIQSVNIAVVDDEEDLRSFLTRTIQELESEGYPVRISAYSDGAELIEAMKQDSNPDIIISDLRMPVVDGVTLLDYLGAKGAKATQQQIIIFSGFLGTVEWDDYPSVQLLPKPLTSKGIRKAIERKVKMVVMERRNAEQAA